MMAENDQVAVGMDLGTTYSCVGVWQNNRVEIIANDLGNRITPSCVAFTDAERFIGEAASNQAARNPVNTVFGTLTFIYYLFDIFSVCLVYTLCFDVDVVVIKKIYMIFSEIPNDQL